MMARRQLGWLAGMARLTRPVPRDLFRIRKFPNTPLDGREDHPYNLSGTEETQGDGVPINQMRIT